VVVLHASPTEHTRLSHGLCVCVRESVCL
jgi:hypothetical protein